MEMHVIRNANDHKAALAAVEELIVLDPKKGTPEAEKLGILALLIEDYETSHFPIPDPEPIEAIKFRMEQQDLTPRDLIPLIGSRSKVSEVLSGKRRLTLPMIRALHEKLGIPSDVLVKEGASEGQLSDDMPWDRYPTKEILKRQWVNFTERSSNYTPQQIMTQFLAPLKDIAPVPALLRRTIHQRAGREMDFYSLQAWMYRIQILAQHLPGASSAAQSIDSNFLKTVAQLSVLDNGPRAACEFLKKNGITVVIEPHLSHTFLDGASMLGKEGQPIIGLTIRHDRLDNFWFCLLHELAHLALHLEMLKDSAFIDNLDVASTEAHEVEADRLAGDALLPRTRWKNSRAYQQRTAAAINEFAAELRISPTIIAGRIRHDSRNYRALNNLVGHGEVRKQFQEVHWT